MGKSNSSQPLHVGVTIFYSAQDTHSFITDDPNPAMTVATDSAEGKRVSVFNTFDQEGKPIGKAVVPHDKVIRTKPLVAKPEALIVTPKNELLVVSR